MPASVLRSLHLTGREVDQVSKLVRLSLVSGTAKSNLTLRKLTCLDGGLALRMLAHL